MLPSSIQLDACLRVAPGGLASTASPCDASVTALSGGRPPETRRILHITDLHAGADRAEYPVDEFEVLRDWLDAAESIQADLVALTGDLTQIPGERVGLIRLKSLLDQGDVPSLVVPGNHDIPSPGQNALFYDIFGGYPRGTNIAGLPVGLLDSMAGLPVDGRTPSERLSAETIGWYSRGRVGPSQLEELDDLWNLQPGIDDSHPSESTNSFPGVLCVHHHLQPSFDVLGRAFDSSAPDRLMVPCLDAHSVTQWAAEHSIRLILHGHQHRWWPIYDAGPSDSSIAVSNPGSSAHGKPARRARALDIDRQAGLTIWELRHGESP